MSVRYEIKPQKGIMTISGLLGTRMRYIFMKGSRGKKKN